jgi:hypothetical protein
MFWLSVFSCFIVVSGSTGIGRCNTVWFILVVFYMFFLIVCKESDARSLRGGGGELGNLKTLTYSFTTFAQSKTRTYYLNVQLRLF